MMTFFHGIDKPLVPWCTQSLVPLIPGAYGPGAHSPWCPWTMVVRVLVPLVHGGPVPLYSGAPGPWWTGALVPVRT
jgi:hypothetical protein